MSQLKFYNPTDPLFNVWKMAVVIMILTHAIKDIRMPVYLCLLCAMLSILITIVFDRITVRSSELSICERCAEGFSRNTGISSEMVACCYLWLFSLHINIKIGKNRC